MNKKLQKDQQGIVSILVSIVLVIILSLVVTSFSVLMRREQRQVLDRQLSTQAFYAAETGVNDAINKLKDNPGLSSNDCDSTSAIVNAKDLGNDSKLTCVLIENKVEDVQFSPIDTNTSKIVKLNVPTARSLNFSWQPSEKADNHEYAQNVPKGLVTEPIDVNDHKLPTSKSGSQYARQVRDSGILRLSIIPIHNGAITRSQLKRETQTLFLYPNQNDQTGKKGIHEFSTSGIDGQGVFVNGECNNDNQPYDCNIEVTNLPFDEGVENYYIRLKAIYSPLSVSISADNDEGSLIQLKNSQAIIDSTGKANDVLRRIQVRVPLQAQYYYPDFAVETNDSLCKRYQLSFDNNLSPYADVSARDICNNE